MSTSFLPASDNVPFFWPKFEFSLLLIGGILSVPCYLFVAYHILFKKTARESLHNHVILMMLLYNFLHVTIVLSLTLNFNRLGYVSPLSPILCTIWQFVDYGIWYGGVSLMCWASFKRHILVFHSNLIRTARQRLLIHYIPLAFVSLYAPLLYFYLIILYPCDRVYVTTSVCCGKLCFYLTIPYWFNLYDSLVNYTIPIILIFIFSLIFFLRFIKQKQRLQQSITWRHCRKMIIQLLMVSATYIIFDLPYVFIYIVRSCGYPNFAINISSPFITRLTFVPGIVLPYAILAALPELRKKLLALYFWKRNRRNIAAVNPMH